jgi:hypothetical protein
MADYLHVSNIFTYFAVQIYKNNTIKDRKGRWVGLDLEAIPQCNSTSLDTEGALKKSPLCFCIKKRSFQILLFQT